MAVGPRHRVERARDQRTKGIRRIGGGDRDGDDLVAIIPHVAQQVDRARLRKLGGTESGYEIPATDAPGFLEPAQHWIHRRESAGQLLDRRHVARDHAVTDQQLIRHRGRPCCRRGRWRWHQRPAAFGRRRDQPARSKRRALARAPRSLRRRRVGAQRVQGVVGQQAFPHQIRWRPTVPAASCVGRLRETGPKNDAPSRLRKAMILVQRR